MKFFYIFILSSFTNSFNCANILFLLPVPIPSHRIFHNVLIEGLAKKGHNLTILTVENEISRPNVTYIYLENIYESVNESELKSLKDVFVKHKSPFKIIKERYYMSNFISRKIFETEGLKTLASYPETFGFQAVIFDFTLGQSLLGFKEHFKFPPLISISPSSQPFGIFSASSTQIMPSFVPHYSTTFTSTQLQNNIKHRFMNIVYHIFDWFYRKYVFMTNENRRLKNVFHKNKLKLEQLEESDLWLINHEFAFSENLLNLPSNVKTVGFLQTLRTESQNQDVLSFIQNSKKPIILFSMGSNFIAEELGLRTLSKLLSAFDDLNEFNFICKCQGDKMKKRKNILFVEWLQQNKLLGSSKVKLIITNAGLLAMQEAVWHKKPVLGIPIDSEGWKNIQRAISLGFAEALETENVSIAEIIFTIRQMIYNSSYLENVMKRAELIDFYPFTPEENAIHFIEKVIRLEGLNHYKNSFKDSSFMKLYMIDFVLVFISILFIYVLILKNNFKRNKKVPINASNEEKKNL